MSDQVLIAIIGAIVALVTLFVQQNRHNRKVSARLGTIGDDAREAKEQVANTHSTNLRDDMDEFRDEMRAILGEVRKDSARDKAELRQELQVIRGDVAQIRESDNADRREHTSIWDAIKSLGSSSKE